MDLKQTMSEPRLLISRSAIQHNARLLRRVAGPEVKLCAIVKADAYGHDARLVADALCNFAMEDASDAPAVDQLAVASIDEAADLPEVSVPVMVLRPIENAFVGRQRAAIAYAIRAG